MIHTQISQKEYKSSIKELNRHKITCTHCGKYLGSIVETIGSAQNNNPKFVRDMKHLCYCPCGNECFVIKTDNPTSVILDGKYTVLDMVCDNTKRINHIKIGIIK